MPAAADNPRLIGSPESSLAILALGAFLGAIAGLLRPLTRSFLGSLGLGALLSEGALLAIRWLVPSRADMPPFRPFGPVLWVGLLLGLAMYLGELHRRTQRSSLAG
jgi:hypothetical protein